MFATRQTLAAAQSSSMEAFLRRRHSLRASSGDIRADLVAELEAVCHGLCRRVDLERSPTNGIFLHAKMQGWSRHAHKANRRRGHARSPRFDINGHPDLVRGLRCELMKLQGGQETNYSFGNFACRFDQRQMLSDGGRVRSIKAASDLSENALLNEAWADSFAGCRGRTRPSRE